MLTKLKKLKTVTKFNNSNCDKTQNSNGENIQKTKIISKEQFQTKVFS